MTDIKPYLRVTCDVCRSRTSPSGSPPGPRETRDRSGDTKTRADKVVIYHKPRAHLVSL